MLAATASYSASSALIAPKADSIVSRTVRLSSSTGSCATMPARKPGVSCAVPWKSVSTPAMMRSTLLLPAPFSPTMPILAPGKKHRLMSFSTCLAP